MATQQGAALQTYNNELVKAMEELIERKAALEKAVDEEKKTKESLEVEAERVRKKLETVNSSLEEKSERLRKYERLISETEQHYFKILESSQTLLNVVKKETKSISSTSNPRDGGSNAYKRSSQNGHHF